MEVQQERKEEGIKTIMKFQGGSLMHGKWLDRAEGKKKVEEPFGSGTEEERRAYAGGKVEPGFEHKPYPKPNEGILGVGIARLGGTAAMVGRPSSLTWSKRLTAFAKSSPFILSINN